MRERGAGETQREILRARIDRHQPRTEQRRRESEHDQRDADAQVHS